MAALKENLLSLGHLTGTERNTFTIQGENRQKKNVNRPPLLQADFSTPQSRQQLRVMHLQQRWQELKERELIAQQHNRQLLQQFEEAQDTMRDMLTLNAAMKTTRMEYERYLEGSSPRWQQQLKEKTQAVERKRMDEYLRSCLKNTEERVMSSADRPLLSQVAGSNAMPQITAAPPKHYSPNSNLNYNQDGCPHLPYMHSSWQTHPQSQMARFPVRAPYQPQGSSHVPPSYLPHPHSFQLHHPTTPPSDHHPRTRQNPAGLAASLHPDYPWSWAARIPSVSRDLWGQLYVDEPPPETGAEREDADTSRALSSKRERGGGGRSGHSSQELDIKPVRLSGGHGESGESSGESSQVSRKKRKKREERGRSHHSSSDRQRCCSQESSGTSSAVVIAAVTVAQSSESEASSEKGRRSTSRRTRRSSGGLSAGSQRDEKVVKGSKRDDSGSHKEESQSTSEELRSLIEESCCEKAENESPDDKSESCGENSRSKGEEESGSDSIKIKKGDRDKLEKQESSSSEQSNDGEKDEEDLGGGEDGDTEEKEGIQTDEEEGDVEDDDDDDDDDDVSDRKNSTEEEEEMGEEEEVEEQEQESEEKGDRDEEESDSLNDEDGENRKKGSVSSQDEEKDKDESEGGEEDGESDEEEQRGDITEGPEEGRDSDDSIISPQDKSKKMHIIPEEENEDESEGGEEDGESDEEEQRGDMTEGPEEGRDSDDSIISPQDKSKKMHIIPEENEDEEEEEEGSKSGSSDDDSNELSDEDDVERLLAPQEQSQNKEEKEPRAEEKPKAICDKVETIQVQPDKSTKADHLSDSDEFDYFYS